MTDNQKFLLRQLHREYPNRNPLTIEFKDNGIVVNGETHSWPPASEALSIYQKSVDLVYQEKNAVKRQNLVIESNSIYKQLIRDYGNSIPKEDLDLMQQLMAKCVADVLGVRLAEAVKDKT